MNASALEKMVLEAVRDALDNEGVAIRAMERRLGQKKNWLSYRLHSKAPMSVGDLFLILLELEISPGPFMEQIYPSRRRKRARSETARIGREHFGGVEK